MDTDKEEPSSQYFFRKFVIFFFVTLVMFSIIEWAPAKTINLSMQPSKNLLFYKVDEQTPVGTTDQDDGEIIFQDVLATDKNKIIQFPLDGILPLFHKHFFSQSSTTPEQREQMIQKLSLMDGESLFKMILEIIKQDASENKIFGMEDQNHKRGYPIQLVDQTPTAMTDPADPDKQHDLFIPLEHLTTDDLILTPSSALHLKETLMEQFIQDMRSYYIFSNPVEDQVDQKLFLSPYGKAIEHLKSLFEEPPQSLSCPTTLSSPTPSVPKGIDQLIKDLGKVIGKFSDYHTLWNHPDVDYEKLLSSTDQDLSSSLKSLREILIKARAKKILCLHLFEKDYIQTKSMEEPHRSEVERLKNDLFPLSSGTSTSQDCLFQEDLLKWEEEKNHLSSKDKHWLTGQPDTAPPQDKSKKDDESSPQDTKSTKIGRGPYLTEIPKDSSTDSSVKKQDDSSSYNQEQLNRFNEKKNTDIAPPLSYPVPVFFPNFSNPHPYMDPLYFSPLFGLWSPFYMSGSRFMF